MRTLRLASFGIQGTVGDALTPELVTDFAAAFGTFLDGGRVLVGRDTRQSSRMFQNAVVAGLISTGCDVDDFGVCPTPMLQYAVTGRAAAGAVSVSGGHSPMGCNALQLIGPKGAFIEPIGGATVLDIFHASDFTKAPWDGIGRVAAVDDFAEPYFDGLAAALDADAIRAAGFTVVIDPVNGAGCTFLEPFARRFGVRLLPINNEYSSYLAHDPEPRPRNAHQVANLMKHVPADIGFVSSSDMGRLSIVSESGETASEEYTFPLIADHVLDRDAGVVVTNCCTTRTLDDVAARHGARVTRTNVGQAYVMSALADENGVLAGEGSGSAAVPAFSRAFDAFLMMGLILEFMARSGRKASELLNALPRYHVVKRSVPAEARRSYRVIDRVLRNEDWRRGGTVSTQDGLRVDWDDGWLHLRASQTEPIVRIISEDRSRETAEARAANVARLLEQAF